MTFLGRINYVNSFNIPRSKLMPKYIYVIIHVSSEYFQSRTYDKTDIAVYLVDPNQEKPNQGRE